MTAKANTNYAVIVNNEVAQIFNGNDIKQWDEKAINAVEIPSDLEVEIGTKFDSVTNSFVMLTLEEVKQRVLSMINFYYEREVGYLQGDLTQSEIETFNTQLKEAKEYKANPKADLPLLSNIAKTRNIDIKVLADKIISKSNALNEKLGILLGYRQNLQKQIEATNDIDTLKKIEYVSPFSENKGA